jgi:hypothetical protein
MDALVIPIPSNPSSVGPEICQVRDAIHSQAFSGTCFSFYYRLLSHCLHYSKPSS